MPHGLMLLTASFLALATGAPRALPLDGSLAFDADHKEYTAQPGETEGVFHFHVQNKSDTDVTITQVLTTCGCTVARLPSQPWRLAPGEGGDFSITVDLRGKSGELFKTATVAAADGRLKMLKLKVTLPDPREADDRVDRARNQALAAANRQAVFQGDCARCHAAPAAGLQGQALYAQACGICHDATQRATMVPDLLALKHPADRAFWREAIAAGRPNTLMPAFASAQGGPLTGEQIESLAIYLAERTPPFPQPQNHP
jgi:mono/diheme cytochrome c family protein